MPGDRKYFKTERAEPWELRFSEAVEPKNGRLAIEVDMVLGGVVRGRLSMPRSGLDVNVVLPLLERRAKVWINEFKAEGEDATTDFADL